MIKQNLAPYRLGLDEQRQIILVVDDQPSNIHALHQLLGDKHEVLMATSGESALEICSQTQPDLLLLDVMMPVMDGYEVCQRLKSSPETAAIPIIFITANRDSESELKGFKSGAIDFICKPFEPSVVLARVKTQLALKHKTDELLASKAFLSLAASVYEHTSEAILILDTTGQILSANQAFQKLVGRNLEDLSGRSFQEWELAGTDQVTSTYIWQEVLTHGHWSGEVICKTQDHELSSRLANINPVRNHEKAIEKYVVILTNISEIKRKQMSLEALANFDPLTGLPNRYLLNDRLNQAITQHKRSGNSLAFCYLDLDGFKLINDNYGHDFGDELLISLANKMRTALREGDTLARIGGDEFIAVISNIQAPQDYEKVLARLLTAASQPNEVKGETLQVSVSIGVSFFPEDGASGEELSRLADHAMYVAKRGGKNRYTLVQQVGEISASIEEDVRDALSNDQLELHFLPRLSFDGKVMGVEGLIRWGHPIKGLLLPGDFISDIQNPNLLCALGEWVIEHALCTIEDLHRIGYTIPISVNISPVHFMHSDFLSHLIVALRRHPTVPPYALELELSEGSVFGDMGKFVNTIKDCLAQHVKVVLDDFGTGYASISHLRNIPCDAIKIDRSLIHNLHMNNESLAVVRGITGMAKAFNKHVIAEGVESSKEIEILATLGCDSAQGYIFARPMRAAALTNWLATAQPNK